MLEAALDCIITVDHEGKVRELDAAAERVFGCDRNVVFGRDLAEVISAPAYCERQRSEIARRLAEDAGGTQGQSTRMLAIRADGTAFPIELSVTRIPLAGPRLFAVHIKDLTAHQRREQRLTMHYTVTRVLAESGTLRHAGSKILRVMCDQLRWHVGGLWYVDPRHQLLRCAEIQHLPSVSIPRFEALSRQTTFKSGVGLPGRVWAAGEAVWIPDVTRADNFPRGPTAAAEGLHGAFAFPIASRDGVLGVIEFFSHDIRQPDDELLELMTAVGSQIGQFIVRKRAEEALQESEQRFSRFMQHLPGLAWIKDRQGRYVYVNDAAEKAFRAGRENLYGKSDAEVFPAEVARQFQGNDQQVLSSGSAIQVIETLEHEDGVLHDSIVSKFPIPGPDGETALIGGVAFDITERRQAEEALREADRRKDEFLATLAHELRNPLAPLRNGLEIMRLGRNNTQAVEKAREMMERQLAQMVRLIDDLLDLSRISRGKITLRKQRLQLDAVVQEVTEISRAALEQASHSLTISLPPECMYVDGDPIRLAKVFSNLLNNAIKFTGQGGQIWLTVQRQGNEAAVSVRDNGIGIPRPMLREVFNMFAQIDRSLERTNGGLGIGLWLVKQLTEMHGGRVEVHSDGEGMGSTFIVRLPLLVQPTTA